MRKINIICIFEKKKLSKHDRCQQLPYSKITPLRLEVIMRFKKRCSCPLHAAPSKEDEKFLTCLFEYNFFHVYSVVNNVNFFAICKLAENCLLTIKFFMCLDVFA